MSMHLYESLRYSSHEMLTWHSAPHMNHFCINKCRECSLCDTAIAQFIISTIAVCMVKYPFKIQFIWIIAINTSVSAELLLSIWRTAMITLNATDIGIDINNWNTLLKRVQILESVWIITMHLRRCIDKESTVHAIKQKGLLKLCHTPLNEILIAKHLWRIRYNLIQYPLPILYRRRGRRRRDYWQHAFSNNNSLKIMGD